MSAFLSVNSPGQRWASICTAAGGFVVALLLSMVKLILFAWGIDTEMPRELFNKAIQAGTVAAVSINYIYKTISDQPDDVPPPPANNAPLNQHHPDLPYVQLPPAPQGQQGPGAA